MVNVPAISFIVDEFVKSGIEDIIIISSRRKKVLEDYFDREIELETVFEKEGKMDRLERILPPANVRFAFVRQQRMLGTGHALLQVKELVGNDVCVVAYPDDLHLGGVPNQVTKFPSAVICKGFGSLDEETLDRAMIALDRVRGQRVIGIVSHVAELRDRVPARIEVFKSTRGSTLRVVS